MTESESPDPEPESPESLFASWLRHHRAGEKPDFEALCHAHAEHEPRLRELRALLEELSSLERRFGLAGSLGDQLTARYGSKVDPKIELEREDSAYGEFSAKLLGRLSGRSSASGRYRLKAEVASGGMGAILRVWDEDLRRHLAMKVMLGQRSGARARSNSIDERTLARFLEEAQITGQLDHPGIVPVHELGLDVEGRVYFTMKLVKGRDLREIYKLVQTGKEGWTKVRALNAILRVCEAVRYAHDKGVIHRDLKPANVMVGRYGEVFVMDWGLAKVLDGEEARDIRLTKKQPRPTSSIVRTDRHEQAENTPDSPLYTMDGDVVGTPAYMPPEQAKGHLHAMGPQSDVYSIGAMLYHLLAGHMPYVPPDVRANNYAVWNQVQASGPPSLSEIAPDTPAELIAICEKAMQRDVMDRYQDADDLARDLSDYLEGRVVHAYETGPWAEARKWVKRNRPLATSMAAGLVALVAGLITSSGLYVRAEDSSQRAQREKEKVFRLSDSRILAELEAEVDGLWPAHPDKIGGLESWLRRAEGLALNLPHHRETLEEMRLQALPYAPEDRERDRSTHPALAELDDRLAQREAAILAVEAGADEGTTRRLELRIEALDAEIADLEAQVEARLTWRFPTNQESWHHDTLAELVEGIDRLCAGPLREDAIDPVSGWSVPARLEAARRLEDGFEQGGEYHARWERDLQAIRATYPGLELTTQMGLVPIGPDQDSHLWEFWHVLSGEEPVRDPTGRLILEEGSGIVFVLFPRVTFWMGAQKEDPQGRNYDPAAQGQEFLHQVTLSAHFLAKYEMTQGQWLRLTGENPAEYGPHNWETSWSEGGEQASLLNPVESVTWESCMTWLPRLGLVLQSEAQWEHGARGGTDTPWWTGTELLSLQGKVNLGDAFGRERLSEAVPQAEMELHDGWAVHAPIGRFPPNAFGLHDAAGNVWEWCRDGYDPDFYRLSDEVDPVGPWDEEVASRVFRGGSYAFKADTARSADRRNHSPTAGFDVLGLRAARAVD